jgi:hypothetical protein
VGAWSQFIDDSNQEIRNLQRETMQRPKKHEPSSTVSATQAFIHAQQVRNRILQSNINPGVMS